MQRLTLFILSAITLVITASAGAIRTVSAEYIYHIPDNIATDEAKEIALQRACAQAIADEFGTVVTQSSSVTIDTHADHTTTDFLSIGGSELKGEWIETIGQPAYEYITDGNDLALRVRVKGRIREIESVAVPFEVRILRNGTDDAFESSTFTAGDDMYLSFNTPGEGYLAIYLIDNDKNAFCLLPYSGQSEGYFHAKANRRYLFFHPSHADGIEPSLVDELVMDTSLPRERNRILAIFSPNRFYKAADAKTLPDLPRSLGYADFQKWLASVRKRDTSLSVTEKAITITPP